MATGGRRWEKTLSIRVVVLISGTGSLLRSLLDACQDPSYGATIVGVGSDRPGIAGLDIAREAGVDTFVCQVRDYENRSAWDEALTDHVAQFAPDLVVSAGFLKLVGPAFLAKFAGKIINTHPALSPAFPGLHAVADAVAHGVKITGCTVFFVDAGVDTGPIIAQRAVEIRDDDTVDTLHERIKEREREMLVAVVAALSQRAWTISGRKVIFE